MHCRCHFNVQFIRVIASLALFLALQPSGFAASSQSVEAELKPDRVIVRIDGELFTEYLFAKDLKYPYFYPVNGPATGRSLTVRDTQPYPHHRSLFFGCDRVNGGNYWQDGLERGRIVSQEVQLLRDSGDEVVFEQTCRWMRPNAPSPFRDQRRIAISAPAPELRYIDFSIRLTAQNKVQIKKTNHALFSARMAPELAVNGGGTLRNAAGDQSESGTFGKPSPWMDYSGPRQGGTEGLAILDHPDNRWFPSPWFTRDYGFFSPTPMNWLENGAFNLDTGETIQLKYRVIVHRGELSQDRLNAEFQKWKQ